MRKLFPGCRSNSLVQDYYRTLLSGGRKTSESLDEIFKNVEWFSIEAVVGDCRIRSYDALIVLFIEIRVDFWKLGSGYQRWCWWYGFRLGPEPKPEWPESDTQ